MKNIARAALLCGGVSMLAVAGAAMVGTPAGAQAVAGGYAFDIPSKPLLAALADYTAVTGIQVVRPSARPISGRSQPVSGRLDADTALSRLLAGSGLDHAFTGPRTVTLSAPAGEAATFVAPAAGGGIVLDTIDVTGGGGGAGALTGTDRIEISQEQLERTSPTDLQDVFAAEPGVSVGSSLPISQKIYVHGVEETNLAVTIDGGRQSNKMFHHNATNLIDPSLLKAVGVDAGVAPADAGPGALGGAVAFETKDARDLLEPGRSFGGFGKLSFDTNSGTLATGLSLYGMHEGFEILGYVNRAKGDEYEDGSGREVVGSQTDMISGIGKLAYQFDSGHRIEVSHERVRDDAPRPFRANIGALTNRPDQVIRDYMLERQNTVLTFTHETPKGWFDPKIVLAYGRTELEVPEPFGSESFADSLNGKAENRFAFGLGSITAGIDFYRDEAEYKDPTFLVGEAASNVGLYAQARLEPFARTRVSFGGRLDHQRFEGADGSEFDNSGFSGNVSAEYDLTDFLTLKAGYSHVWAGVSLAEVWIGNPDWNYFGGPEPTTADNFNAGLVVRYEGFSFEGGVFRTDISDVRDPEYDLDDHPDGAVIARDVVSEGYELAAAYSWTGGFARAAFASIDVEIDGQPADSDVGQYIATPIGEVLTFTAAHTFDRWGLTVGGDVKFVFENDDVAAGTPSLPGYEVANVFAEYKPLQLPNLTLRAELNNMFDETYADRATYGQEFSNVIPLREPGRSFLLSATVRY